MAGLVRSLHSLLPRTSIPCRAMAGHSKWSNIRHVKGAKDAKFQKIAGRISQRIRTVIREGGSNDPKYNFLLARIITEAKSLDIPKSTIENAIKGSSKGKEAAVVHFIEGKGVGNCFIIVETYTERTKHIRQQIQHVLKKFSGSIGQSGFASHSYVNKGCVYVPLKSKEGAVVDADIDNKLSAMTMDDAENIAIEVDSEEVNEDYDEDGTRVFKFITDQKCLHTVKAAIEAIPLAVSEARLEYIAQVKVHLDQKQLVSFADMMTALREQEDVIRIYHNIDNETDIDSALEAVSKS